VQRMPQVGVLTHAVAGRESESMESMRSDRMRTWKIAILAGLIVCGGVYMAQQAGLNVRPFLFTLSLVAAAVLIYRQFNDGAE